MFICVQCNRCQSRFKTEANHAGKSAHCPQCQQPLTIPELGHQPELNSSEFVSNNTQDLLSEDQVHLAEQLSSLGNSSFGSNGKPDKNSIAKHLLDGFTGPISKNRPTVSYLVSTIVVAFVMLLLPLIYLSLMGLVSYGVVHYAWNNVNMIRDTSTLIGFLIMGIGYGTPIFAGTFLVLVMFKPLLARQPSQVRIRSLRRDKEPLLFGFIDKICESVDAPRPTRIDIDCQLNASASYGRGLACLFSKDLVLTIGLPMVAGLNTRQLAGVLAHEFGHFAQGAGMRMTHVIRVISHWLLRVVYERDAIDDWLERATQAFEVYLAWLPYLASVFIWVTRKILWVLMMIGQLFGSYLLRQNGVRRRPLRSTLGR